MVDEPDYESYQSQLLHALYAKWDQWRTPYELCGYDDHGESLWLQCIARCHDDKAIFRQKPFPGAVEVCNELIAEGHYLTYISNRATESERATEEWLTWHGFMPVFSQTGQQATKLVVTSGDKEPFIRDCQYMIDDRPKNVVTFIHNRDWPAGKRKAFVRVTDYNGGLTDVPGLYLAHTWQGMARYMIKEGLLPSKPVLVA